MTTLIALLLISGAQQSAPLDRLHELAKSDRPDRFEEIVHYVESAPSEAEARDGMKVLSEAVGELSKRLAALHSLPPTQREARYLELVRPSRGTRNS